MEHISDSNTKVFKVATTTSCTVLATGLFKELSKEPPTNLVIRAVGASAVNQAIKAIANLNGLLAPKNKVASIIPYFNEVKFADSEKPHTVIEMKLIVSHVR